MKSTKSLFWYGWKAVLAIILFAIAMAILMVGTNGCTSKSGQLMHVYEKAVVLDSSYPTYYMKEYTEGYKYRLKRIERQNVTSYVYNPNQWTVGDTILLRFADYY